MAKKDKAMQSTDAKAKLDERTDDLMDDIEDIDVEYDDEGLLTTAQSADDRRSAARRRLEDYLEEKRLKKELGDDFDLF